MATAQLEYSLPPAPVSGARQFEEIVFPKAGGSGTFKPRARVEFDIPTGQRNTYLDPSKTYLEFTLQNLSSDGTPAAAQLDGSAHSLIQTVRLFDKPSGTEIEVVENANHLHHIINNATQSKERAFQVGSLLEGYLPARKYATTWWQSNGDSDTYGQYFGPSDLPTVNEQSRYIQTMAIPILSTVGLLGDKYIPVHALVRPLQLRLNLAQAEAVFKQCTPTLSTAVTTDIQADLQGAPYANRADVLTSVDYSVTNMQLHLGYVQIPDEAQAAIDAATQKQYSWVTKTYRCFENSTPGLNTRNWWMIPARLTSARHVITVFKPRAALSSLVSNFTSFSPKMYTTSAQYMLGQTPLPQRPMKSVAVIAKNLFTCFGDKMHESGRFSAQNFWVDLANNDSTNKYGTDGTFAIGVDIGGPCGDETNYLMSGANTNGADLSLMTEHSQAMGQSTIVMHFVCHDALFKIDDQGNFSVTI